MKKFKLLLVALFSTWLLTACSQTNLVEQGTPLSKEKVSKITEGVTTESQLRALFGEPTSKTVVNTNATQWTYKYVRKTSTMNALFGETQYNIIEGTLDAVVTKGIVTWFNYNENNKQKKW
ncbi:outer membrane protein assembly factor BamE [Orbaceae bacterium ESL0727]|nr:outer membrane protein assembly factor BamE [Orbaceae bacterium ESL0727]